MERDERGHWLPGRSANPGGRPGVADVIKATLRELSPRAVKRLGELLDSEDERIQLEAAKAILDRHLGRPAIQADVTVRVLNFRLSISKRCSRWRGRGEPSRSIWMNEMSSTSGRARQTRSSPAWPLDSGARMLTRL